MTLNEFKKLFDALTDEEIGQVYRKYKVSMPDELFEKIPEGYEWTGQFGLNHYEQPILTTYFGTLICRNRYCTDKTLVLRKIETKPIQPPDLSYQPKATTVKDVYGVTFNELTAPNSYEFTGEFRIPDGKEPYLTANGYVNSYVLNEPRLILRKVCFKVDPLVSREVRVKDIYESVLEIPTKYRLLGLMTGPEARRLMRDGEVPYFVHPDTKELLKLAGDSKFKTGIFYFVAGPK